jgi:hypothetical protein
MDSPRAREVLRLFRPGTTDALDPQMAEAIQVTHRDAELAKWFEGHCAVYIAIRNKLKQIEVPPDLKRKILVENVGRAKIIPLRRRPQMLWAAAAAIALLAAGLWYFNKPTGEVRFALFRKWKVSEVQRPYTMTHATNYAAILAYLQTNHFIADYTLTKSLAKLPPDGFSTNTFQGKPVTMLCFNRGTVKNGKPNEVFFFVAHRADFVGSPLPGKRPQFEHKDVGKTRFTSAAWSADDKVYIIATQGDDSDVQQYID